MHVQKNIKVITMFRSNIMLPSSESIFTPVKTQNLLQIYFCINSWRYFLSYFLISTNCQLIILSTIMFLIPKL